MWLKTNRRGRRRFLWWWRWGNTLLYLYWRDNLWRIRDNLRCHLGNGGRSNLRYSLRDGGRWGIWNCFGDGFRDRGLVEFCLLSSTIA